VRHAIGIIPARYDSKRFPGKPLALLGGVPIIVRVLRIVEEAESVSEACVATDDKRIASVVEEHGGHVIMTSENHPTGSDRVAEAALSFPSSHIIVNVQGDEPFLSSDIVDRIVAALDDPEVLMSTACTPVRADPEAGDPNVVKVVLDEDRNALYFSRSRVPYDRTGGSEKPTVYRHIGIYGFKRDFLLEFCRMERTPLEKAESLEQLRVLENGIKIRSVIVDGTFPGIDSEEDLFKAEELLRKGQM
jgi:3-deoxy-manno-octulosonate cytidylyltransferase (CMP-KDO synthetase)